MARRFEADREAAPTPRVLVSVLTYNSPGSTAETLRSLRRQTYTDFRLLLIDNASDDDSAERLAREFPELEIRRLPENRGYTGGNNVALDLARAGGFDCLLVATHDVEVEPRALERLVKTAAAHADAGVVGGVELNAVTGQIGRASCRERG